MVHHGKYIRIFDGNCLFPSDKEIEVQRVKVACLRSSISENYDLNQGASDSLDYTKEYLFNLAQIFSVRFNCGI